MPDSMILSNCETEIADHELNYSCNVYSIRERKWNTENDLSMNWEGNKTAITQERKISFDCMGCSINFGNKFDLHAFRWKSMQKRSLKVFDKRIECVDNSHNLTIKSRKQTKKRFKIIHSIHN